VPLAPLLGGVVVAGGEVVAGGVVVDGAGCVPIGAGAAEPGSILIPPEVPPVPVAPGVWVGFAGACVSSMGGVAVGLGVPGDAPSGRTGSGVVGAGAEPGSAPTPAPLGVALNGDRLLPLSTLLGRAGGAGTSAGLAGGSSREPGGGLGVTPEPAPEVFGTWACASHVPVQLGAALARFVARETSAATGRFAVATSSIGTGCKNSIAPPC
jgi:hypothetical protein